MTNNIAKIRAALEMARDYITSDLASERGAFEGYEGLSRIDEIKADLKSNESALAALAELEKAAGERDRLLRNEAGLLNSLKDSHNARFRLEARLAAIEAAPVVATVVDIGDECGPNPNVTFYSCQLPPVGTELIARPARD